MASAHNFFKSYKQYEEIRDGYLANSGQRKADFDALRSRLPSVINKTAKTSSGTRFNMLSIGSGPGEVDQEILNIIKGQIGDRKILIRAVEPNPHSIDKYKASVQYSDEITLAKLSVEYEFYTKTFQEYVAAKKKAASTKEPFNLINCVHSVYYLDLEPALVHCYKEELVDEGAMVFVTMARSHPINTVDQALSQAGLRGASAWFTIHDIEQVATRHKWKYEKFHFEFSIDVTEVFDEASVTGNLVLDFLTAAVEFRKKFSDAATKNVLQHLLDRSSEEADGRRLVTGSDDLILIYKTPGQK